MSQLPIDLDAESIQYDGRWYTREELARRIRQMLDSGDFAVSRPSQALEQLTSILTSVRTLAFRLAPDMADQLNQIAVRHGRTLGSLIRESLQTHLSLKGGLTEGTAANSQTPVTPQPSTGKKVTNPELPEHGRVGQHPTPPVGIPIPSAAQGNSVVTEEASPEDAAAAVSLGGPKKKGDDEDSIERGWFGR